MKKAATFLIQLEWTEEKNKMMSSQIARDKLMPPVQEMWIMHYIDKFTLEELEQTRLSLLQRGNKKGKRESFYKTGFPAKKRK